MSNNLLAAGLATVLVMVFSQPVMGNQPRVWLDTDQGPIFLELDAEQAPVTTQNFLDYVNEGFYDGIVFHRVVDDFVIQAGGFDENFQFREPTADAIPGEAGNGLSNQAGTIAMATVGGDPDTARAQFYINVADNDFLDGDYTVFGQVIDGHHTVDRIKALPAGTHSLPEGNFQDAPVRAPLIRRAAEVDGFPLMPLHSASWFDPATSGVGFNVEVTNIAPGDSGPILVVYWYDFSQGEQIWLTGARTFQWGASEVTVDLREYQGENDNVDFQNPPDQSDFGDWGTLTVRFEDCTNGLFSYDSPSFGQGEISVRRLTIPDQAFCD